VKNKHQFKSKDTEIYKESLLKSMAFQDELFWFSFIAKKLQQDLTASLNEEDVINQSDR
jgi:hypothetical protein